MSTLNSVAIALQSGLTPLLWGAPGIGKTSTILSIGRGLDVPVIVVIASYHDPTDFGGLPVLTEGGVKLEPPRWAKEAAEHKRVIVFFDEITTAPPAVQAPLLRVIQERWVGDLKLPSEVMMAAAANPPEQAACGQDLAPPLANRLIHIMYDLNVDRWCEGMVSSWPQPEVGRLPDDWQMGIPAARNTVQAFVHLRKNLLLDLPKEPSQAGLAWPSPRTWDMASICLAATTSIGLELESDTTLELVMGCVGKGAALEFVNWARTLDLVDPEGLLEEPGRFSAAMHSDTAFVVLGSVVTAAIQNPSPRRWRSAWKVLTVAAEKGFLDVAAVSARALLRNRPRGVYQAPKEAADAFAGILRKAGLLE